MILSPLPKQQLFDNNGNPADQYKLFTYVAGTSTKQTTYIDSTGTPNTNPIILNYRGECDLWLDPLLTYKFVFTYPNDTDPPTRAIWTVDNIPGGYSGLIDYTKVYYDITPAENAAGVTPVNYYIPSHDICGYAIVERYATNTTPGTTDMKTAAQAAVNVALQAKCNVGVITQCRLSGSVNIDRLVDGAAFDSYFRVVGLGERAGFYATTAIAMFSTTIAFTTAPVTQLVSFENVNFEASGTGFDAFVLDDAKYLRTKFTSCNFVKIKCLYAPTVFCQSIYFYNCNIRRFTGIFFRSLNVNFDIKFAGNIMEAGDQFARMAFPVGCSFQHNLIEGCSGTAVKAWGINGLDVSGNYFEQNDCDLDFRPSAAESSYGVTLSGNNFNHTPSGAYAPSSTYSIRWGNTFSCVSSGNYGSTYLHELNAGAQVKINDFAVTAVSNAPGIQYTAPYNAPAFSARNASAQSITTTTFTKITLGTEEFDTNANFASSTFTPTVAGYYRGEGVVKVAGTNISRFAVAVYKNGTEFARLFDIPLPNVATYMANISLPEITANGTTDNFELWVFVIATTPTVEYAAATDCTRFSMHYVRNNS